MKNNNILIIVLAAIVSLGAGFFGGMTYQKSLPQTFNRQGNFAASRNGQNGTARIGNGNRPISGQITAMDDKSITLKMPDGSSRIVIYSASTKISKTTDGSAGDLKTGTEVTVMGTAGTDGTETAQNIFIGAGFLGGGMRGPTPTKTP